MLLSKGSKDYLRNGRYLYEARNKLFLEILLYVLFTPGQKFKYILDARGIIIEDKRYQ